MSIMDKIRKVYEQEQGERAVGNEDAAARIAELLRGLLAKHKLTMLDVESHCVDATEQVEQRAVAWEDHGLERKRRRCEWTEKLALIVAKAHGCASLCASGTNRVWIVGKSSNVDVAEFSLVTLTRAAIDLADRSYRAARKEAGGSPGREFRASFLHGFVARIGQRFDEIEDSATQVGGDDEAALVLLRDDYAEASEAVSGLRPARPIGGASTDWNAYRRGAAEASSVDLEGRAVRGDGSGSRRLGS